MALAGKGLKLVPEPEPDLFETMPDEELDTLVEYRQGCAEVRDAMQAEMDTVSTRLKEELRGRGVVAVEREKWVVQMVHQDRTTLNKKKLLSAGVTMAQIEAATEVTPVEQLRVVKRYKKE